MLQALVRAGSPRRCCAVIARVRTGRAIAAAAVVVGMVVGIVVVVVAGVAATGTVGREEVVVRMRRQVVMEGRSGMIPGAQARALYRTEVH